MDLLVPHWAKDAGAEAERLREVALLRLEKAVTPHSCGSQPDICREFSLYFPFFSCSNSLPAAPSAHSRSWECFHRDTSFSDTL